MQTSTNLGLAFETHFCFNGAYPVLESALFLCVATMLVPEWVGMIVYLRKELAVHV